MGTGDLCLVPPPAVHPGRAKQCSGTGPCGYCRRVLWVPDPRGQYSGKIRFIEKPGVQDVYVWGGGGGRGRHVAKRSSDPQGSLPRSQCLGTGPSASCGYCCLLCPAGVQYSFYRASGNKPKAVYPLSRTSKLGGMKHDHTYPPHRAPMRACRYVQSSDRRSMRRELYAALRHYLIFTGNVQLKNRADIYRSYLCMLSCRLFRDLINDPRSVSWPSYSSVR